MQVFTADGVEPVRALDCGEFGMSSLVIRPEAGVVYGSSGNDFFRLDLDDGKVTELAIEGVVDSHEVTEIDGTLWIANTGRDEAVAFDLATEAVARRVPVRAARTARAGETVDKFHANQVVRALDGKLYVLVHHVDGKQIVKYVAQRLVKMQGNGGVIELETGRPVPLSLSGPHSIEAVGPDEQWICDSRAGVLRVYDRDWREQAQIPCAGWGRGVSVSPASGRVYVGISSIRKRYLQVIPTSQHSQNMVQAFDVAGRTLIGETLVPNLETINNVYVVSRETGRAIGARVAPRTFRHGGEPPCRNVRTRDRKYRLHHADHRTEERDAAHVARLGRAGPEVVDDPGRVAEPVAAPVGRKARADDRVGAHGAAGRAEERLVDLNRLLLLEHEHAAVGRVHVVTEAVDRGEHADDRAHEMDVPGRAVEVLARHRRRRCRRRPRRASSRDRSA